MLLKPNKKKLYLLSTLSLSLITTGVLSYGSSALADSYSEKKVLINALDIETLDKSDDTIIVDNHNQEVNKDLNISLDFGIGYKTKKTLTREEREYIAYKKAWEREKKFAKQSEGLSVPDGVANCDSSCRSWMSYTAVTATTSPQYKLLHSSEAHTHPKYGIRMIGDRYCAALGSGYASKIGTKFDVVMKNGSVVKCILGDQKSDRGTDKATHRFHQFYDGTDKPGDGSVLEMIVDTSVFRGDVSQFPDELDGYIEKIVIIE